MEMQTTLTPQEILAFLSESGTIDLDGVEAKVKMKKIDSIVSNNHAHKIWQGKDGRWRTFVYDETKPKKRGNYTHGERAYSHVTSEVVDMLYQDGVKGNVVNQQAALFALTKYIEWGTGRFRKLRKDRKGNDKMQLQDIEKAIRRSKKVTKQTMDELIANGIVKVIDGEYYFVNGLISKGRKK